MKTEEKLQVLKYLDTKSLETKLRGYEDSLEKAMKEESNFKQRNHGYLGSGDCQEVKRILAELSAHAPETSEAGRKMTIADREVWLQKQRTENKELADAIARQHQVSFLIDDFQIKTEMARRRITGATVVLALKTAQITFLAGD